MPLCLTWFGFRWRRVPLGRSSQSAWLGLLLGLVLGKFRLEDLAWPLAWLGVGQVLRGRSSQFAWFGARLGPAWGRSRLRCHRGLPGIWLCLAWFWVDFVREVLTIC